MANENMEINEEQPSMFDKIRNAIARRSEVIKQHEADYAALMTEKETAERDRDTYLEGWNKSMENEKSAKEALEPTRQRAETAEAFEVTYKEHLAQIARDLGVDPGVFDPAAHAQADATEAPAAKVPDKPAKK